MIRRTIRATALAGWCLALAPGAFADQSKADDPVVAVVNGAEILRSQVVAARQQLPRRYRELPMETLFPMLVNGLIDSKLAATEARRMGLHEDPEIKGRLARIEEQILERAFLARRTAGKISEDALRERYRKRVADSDGQEQVRASHILVETRAQAKQVIAELDSGADFAATARQRSTGPSAAQGGDLGFFKRGEMEPTFSDAAFALQTGAITKSPVQSQFGWHVIKAVDRRQAEVPAFEEIEASLRAELSREIGASLIQDLRKGARIKRFKPDGGPLDGDAKKE